MKELNIYDWIYLTFFVLMMLFCAPTIAYAIWMIIKGSGCKHSNIITRVIYTAATCETTSDFCADCGVQVGKTKTDTYENRLQNRLIHTCNSK